MVALELLRLQGAQHGVPQLLFGRGPWRDLPRAASGEPGLAIDTERENSDIPGALGAPLAQPHHLAAKRPGETSVPGRGLVRLQHVAGNAPHKFGRRSPKQRQRVAVYTLECTVRGNNPLAGRALLKEYLR